MKLHSVAIVVCAIVALGSRVSQAPAAAAGSPQNRAADLAAIEMLWQHDISATISRDPVALSNNWTDDAIRLGAGAPADVGKKTILESNTRQSANKDFKVLSYVPETKDFAFLDGGYAVAWRAYTASFVAAPGAATTNAHGTVLMVLKKLPDGSWKVFRAMGTVETGK